MLIEHAGWQHMQCELAVVVLDGVSRIASALETDDDIRILRQSIRYFTFSFVAPVGANDSFYH